VAPTRLPHVAVLALGGTIAAVGDASSGPVPRLNAADLISAVPQLTVVADVTAQSFRMVGSPDLTFRDAIELAAAIEGLANAGTDGFVVTQGTDTLEETAYCLDLLLSLETPVAVTGAMRPPAHQSADGPGNLLAAVQLAADPATSGLGVVVVFGDEVHAARFVRKVHSHRPAAFRSPMTGPIGWVVEGRPRIALRPVGRPNVSVRPDAEIAPVGLYKVGMDDDSRLIRLIASSGYAGMVVEGTGGGHVPGRMAEALGDLASKMPVVLASRTGAGETLRGTYGLFPGSETDLIRRNLISAGWLDGIKARVLLTLLLTAGAARAQVADVFEALATLGSDVHFP
jgi:L-asparaginase